MRQSEVAVENTVYSNRFVLSVLVNNQVVKEFANGEVHVPFGSLYTLRLRNKHDRRAVCVVTIDGEKVCKGGFVVPANSYRDIDCSSVTLQKFKFVDLQSADAQAEGKDQANENKEMGLIVARWHLEKEKPKPTKVEHHHHHHHDYYPWYPYRPYPYRLYPDLHATYGTTGCTVSWSAQGAGAEKVSLSAAPRVGCCLNNTDQAAILKSVSAESVSDAQPMFTAAVGFESVAPNTKAVRDGATVEGGRSDMRFGEMNVDIEDHYTELKLYLRGFDEVKEAVVTPAAVGDAFCDRCGAKAARKSSRFCHACGEKLPG